jgi:hypothetical protein
MGEFPKPEILEKIASAPGKQISRVIQDISKDKELL